MCRLCDAAAASAAYGRLLDAMRLQDAARLERTKALAGEMGILRRTCCSSMKLPVKLQKPMFEARTAFAVPHSYYQNLFLDGEKLGIGFAHGAMRSVFFSGGRLVLFSKTVDMREGGEFFTSFVLLHLEPGEYSFSVKGEEVAMRADVEKPMRNLVTNDMERRKVKFAFSSMPLTNRIVSRDKVLTSAQFKGVYARHGGAEMKTASINLEGYAITVPHFSPHPFMLQAKEGFGYASNRQFQEGVVKDYFAAHLGK